MFHYLGRTSIFRSLSYPFRSLNIIAHILVIFKTYQITFTYERTADGVWGRLLSANQSL